MKKIILCLLTALSSLSACKENTIPAKKTPAVRTTMTNFENKDSLKIDSLKRIFPSEMAPAMKLVIQTVKERAGTFIPDNPSPNCTYYEWKVGSDWDGTRIYVSLNPQKKTTEVVVSNKIWYIRDYGGNGFSTHVKVQVEKGKDFMYQHGGSETGEWTAKDATVIYHDVLQDIWILMETQETQHEEKKDYSFNPN